MTGERGATFRQALEEELPGLSAPERRAAFLGLLQRHLPEGEEAILVGGGLVELLTDGHYVTGDLDLVGDRDAIGSLLAAAGFDASGRHLVHEDLGLTVEIVSPHLDPERRSERLRWREHTLHVLSIEDLVVDRLCAAEFWGSGTDLEQAQLVYATHASRIDEERLRSRAEDEGVLDRLELLASQGADP